MARSRTGAVACTWSSWKRSLPRTFCCSGVKVTQHLQEDRVEELGVREVGRDQVDLLRLEVPLRGLQRQLLVANAEVEQLLQRIHPPQQRGQLQLRVVLQRAEEEAVLAADVRPLREQPLRVRERTARPEPLLRNSVGEGGPRHEVVAASRRTRELAARGELELDEGRMNLAVVRLRPRLAGRDDAEPLEESDAAELAVRRSVVDAGDQLGLQQVPRPLDVPRELGLVLALRLEDAAAFRTLRPLPSVQLLVVDLQVGRP